MKKFMKLRGRIVEKYGTQSAFAKKIGRSEVSVVNKLNGKTEFSQKDIIDWSNALDITKDEVGSFYFAEKL